jgi:hypothetical protein
MEDFQFLHDQVVRIAFIEELNNAIDKSPFEIISMAIDKRHLLKVSSPVNNPYQLSLEHCIEVLYEFLKEKNQLGKLTHIIIESRGKKEDDELQVTFQKILESHNALQAAYPLKLIFADKKTNSIGLQLADLIAYPIGRYLINPAQENRAFNIVEKKLRSYPQYYGHGLKVFPRVEPSEKRKTPEFSEVSAD